MSLAGRAVRRQIGRCRLIWELNLGCAERQAEGGRAASAATPTLRTRGPRQRGDRRWASHGSRARASRLESSAASSAGEHQDFPAGAMGGMDKNHPFGIRQMENGNGSYASEAGTSDENSADGSGLVVEPYGIPCMVEIFHCLCSLLNVVEQIGFDEDLPLFALKLINSAIQLGGSAIGKHPKLLSLVQDELFRNLMQFGLLISPIILSTGGPRH